MKDNYSLNKLLSALSIVACGYLSMYIIMFTFMTLMPEWTKTTNGRLTLQAIQTIVLFGLTTFIGIKITEKQSPTNAMRINQPLTIIQGLIIFMFAVIALPAINLLAEINAEIRMPGFLGEMEKWMKDLEENSRILTEQLINTTSPIRLLINIIIMAALPAICEEMMFRGWLQRKLYLYTNYNIAIWITAFIFSAIHMQFYGFLPRMIIGAGIGYIYFYTKTLWGPILAHFVNNTMVVIAGYMTFNNITDINFESIGTEKTWYIGMASIIIGTSLIYKMAKLKNKA